MGNYEQIYDSYMREYLDYNPAHAIWHLLTLAGVPESFLNSESFLAASITLYDEGTGIGGLLNYSLSTKELVQQILNHIRGALSWGSDGKFHIVLIRDNYNVEDLPVVNENVIVGSPLIERPSWVDTVGEIQIQYNRRFYPPSGLRYYQEAVEVLRRGRPFVRNYHEVVEAIQANTYVCIDDIAVIWSLTSTTTV